MIQRARRAPNIAIGSVILAVIGLLLLVPLVWTVDPVAQNIAARFQLPGGSYPLGTDSLGRDVLARLASGGHVSLAIGGAAIALGSAIGLVAGLAAALTPRGAGRTIDAGISLLMAFPALLLALFIASLVGSTAPGLVVAIGLSNVAVFARLSRAEALRIQQQLYLEAARGVGGRLFGIVGRHVLPNIWPPVIVAVTLRASTAILTEATLSYLGLGLPPPQPTWGRMILDGQRQLEAAPWVTLVPGVAIMLTVLGLNLVGDGLRDVLDPRLRGQREGGIELRAA